MRFTKSPYRGREFDAHLTDDEHNLLHSVGYENLSIALRIGEEHDPIDEYLLKLAKPYITFLPDNGVNRLAAILVAYADRTDEVLERLPYDCPPELIETVRLERTQCGDLAAQLACSLCVSYDTAKAVAARY